MRKSDIAPKENSRRRFTTSVALAIVAATLSGAGSSLHHIPIHVMHASGASAVGGSQQESGPFQLVGYEPLEGAECARISTDAGSADAGSAGAWELASASFASAWEAAPLTARSLGQSGAPSSDKTAAQPLGGDIRPVRTIEDPYSVFAAIAVDPVHDEVVMSDENRFNLLVYGRTTTNSKGVSEPRRQIGGLHSRMEFICGVAVDPETREIFTVNNDTLDNMVVFSPEARGDAPPTRELQVDHGAWGVSLDSKHNEIAVSIEHYNKIAFYSKAGQGDAGPLRIIQGEQTGLADPHGVYVDTKNDEVVVSNHGAWHMVQTGEGGSISRGVGGQTASSRRESPGGRFGLPSVRVFSRTATGDAAPLRVIEGPHTRLSLPQGVFVDPESDQILVANDGGNSVLFFPRTAQGDVAPIRTIEGPATGVKNPNGVVVDVAHNEIWVTNWGDHSATVYARTAQGNVAPLRTIRTAPPKSPQSGLGNPGAVGYDPVRQEIAVPN